MAPTITRKDLLARRLASQGLSSPTPSPAASAPPASASPSPASVVQRMLAMQAQDFGQGVWTIGSRVPGSTLTDVLAALDRGEIVRSWPMRGTLHFVDPQDLRWMLRLTTPRLHQGLTARFRQLDLDTATFTRAEEVAHASLGGGRSLTREGFIAALEESGIVTTGQRSPHLIGWLAQRGVVCWGPSSGRQQALVLLDEWAPEAEVFDRDRSLREYALRYFTGHGPASVRDLAWWTKLTLADARRGVELAADELVEVDFEGTPQFLGIDADAAASVASQTQTQTPAGAGALFALAGFDEYILGYQDRSVAVPEEHLDDIVPGNNGIFLPTIVWGGRVIGTWRRSTTASAVTVTPIPFTRFTARQSAALARAVRRYGDFLGLPARIVAPTP